MASKREFARQLFQADGSSCGIVADDVAGGLDLHYINRRGQVARTPLDAGTARRVLWALLAWFCWFELFGLQSVLRRLTIARGIRKASRYAGPQKTASVAWPKR